MTPPWLVERERVAARIRTARWEGLGLGLLLGLLIGVVLGRWG